MGRPKGSKNKPKQVTGAETGTTATTPTETVSTTPAGVQ